MTRTEFQQAYAECLTQAVTALPSAYYYPAEKAPEVAAKMCNAMAAHGARSVNITGSDGFKLLAKRLGIKHTVRAIAAAWDACTS